MTSFLFITGALGFLVFASLYGIKAGKTRQYIKEFHPKLYSEKQLDGFSLMLGPPEVSWNAQLFILKKEYLKFPDSELVKLCNSAYICGVRALTCFCILFLTAIWSSTSGS